MGSANDRPTGVVNGEALEGRSVGRGHLGGTWRNLGRAAGTRTVGLRRVQIDEGKFSTPVHVHGADEEIFFVLGGTGLLWQAGATFTLGPEDCIVHAPGAEAHTLRGGRGGLDALAFGQRLDTALPLLPRAGVAWVTPSWVEIGAGTDPWEREAAAGPPDCPPPQSERPPNVVNVCDTPAEFGGVLRRPARAAGARASGLSHVTLPPESSGAPPHCHSLEEEIFVVLSGGGTLVLYERPNAAPGEYPVAGGDVISRPAATGVAHAFRSGPQGMTLLAYGTREPNDMCFYPESGTVALRGLGITFRPEVQRLSDGR